MTHHFVAGYIPCWTCLETKRPAGDVCRGSQLEFLPAPTSLFKLPIKQFWNAYIHLQTKTPRLNDSEWWFMMDNDGRMCLMTVNHGSLGTVESLYPWHKPWKMSHIWKNIHNWDLIFIISLDNMWRHVVTCQQIMFDPNSSGCIQKRFVRENWWRKPTNSVTHRGWSSSWLQLWMMLPPFLFANFPHS